MTIDITPDLDQASCFLNAIDPDVSWLETPWCFQTFLDKGNSNTNFRAWHEHGLLPDIAGRLTSANRKLGGAFVVINETDGLGRDGDNIVRVRAVFADLDGAPLDPILSCGLPPHVVVESSAGCYQVFWRVSDCGLEKFKAVQLALAARFNSDENVADKSRVMRLPGFYHRKHGGCFMSKLITCDAVLKDYTLQELVEGLGLKVEESKSPTSYHEPEMLEELTDEQLSDLRSALACIPSDERKLWVDMLHALKTLGDEGYALALEWSEKSEDMFDHDDFERVWASCNPNRTNYKTVFKMASDNYGWVNPSSFVATLASEDFGHSVYPRTEFGLAARFYDQYGESVMYVQELASWYTWDGANWTRSGGAEISHRAVETINGLLAEVGSARTSEDRQALLKFALNCQKCNTTANLIKLAQSDLRLVVPANVLDKNMHLLGAANGAIDLRSGDLIPPNPLHRITIFTEVEYDKNAKAPIFEQTVSDAFFGKTHMIVFFKRLIGYILSGKPDLDYLVIPYGCGSNGKSTILNAIRTALGPHAKMASSDTFLTSGGYGSSAGGPREDVLRLRGARLVYVTEPDEGSELREGLIKCMTGGEPMPARGIHAKETIEVTPTWTATMPTNHLPFVKGSDHAIWRRLLPIPFTRNFSTDPNISLDPDRATKLAAEVAGILAWCVQGAKDYLIHGLGTLPKEIEEARASYRLEMDVLKDWLDECCELDSSYECTFSDLWNSWKAWAEPHGMLRKVSNSNFLGRLLTAKQLPIIAKVKGVKAKGRQGIRLKGSPPGEFLQG